AVTRAREAGDLAIDAEHAAAGEFEAARQPEPKAKYAKPTSRARQGKLALTATKAEQSRGREAEGVDAAEAAEIARLAAEAQKAMQGGEWARALALYEDLLARQPAPEDEAKFLAAKATCEAKLQKPEFAETLKRLEALAPEQAAALRREFGKALKAGEIQRMAPARQAGRTTAPVKLKRWHPTADDYDRQ
ncbi:MAG: hypothetical protein N3A66_07545, partial [Planctomycetota bacterium]|nr:hypothetical protein [Planctomycetota bacterium]